METTEATKHSYTLLMFKYMLIKVTYYNIRLVIDGELGAVSLLRPIVFPFLFWLPAGVILYFCREHGEKNFCCLCLV